MTQEIMSETEILWYALAVTLTVLLIVLIGSFAVLMTMGAERQRRRDDAVDRDLEARRAQFPDPALKAAVESALADGRITPATAQRFIDRSWLDPR